MMPPMTGSYEGIDPAAFRAAMRRFPGQVCVLTAANGAERIAMTATAVTSVSAEPPQMLACVHAGNRTAGLITQAGVFGVNLLSRGQSDVASQCALPGLDAAQRFSAGSWRTGPACGVPLLEGATVAFECRLADTLDAGTHRIFVGLIRAVTLHHDEPLLYHDAAYRQLAPQHPSLAAGLAAKWDSAIRGF